MPTQGEDAIADRRYAQRQQQRQQLEDDDRPPASSSSSSSQLQQPHPSHAYHHPAITLLLQHASPSPSSSSSSSAIPVPSMTRFQSSTLPIPIPSSSLSRSLPSPGPYLSSSFPCPSLSPPSPSSPLPPLSPPPPPDSDVWIFGYGSLCWRPDFPFVSSHPAFITGFHRRFYQGSPDHRGTQQRPGRVVTLVPADDGEDEVRTYGVVYLVHREQVKHVLSYLDVREQRGYSLHTVTAVTVSPPAACRATSAPCSPPPPVSVSAMTYLATPSNADFLGPAPLESIALTIATSVGSSGHNREYLFRLHDWLESVGGLDEHVTELVERVRRIEMAGGCCSKRREEEKEADSGLTWS